MKTFLTPLAAAATLAMTACATDGQTERANAPLPAAATADAIGAPVGCINSGLIASTKGITRNHMMFEMKGGRLYRNELSGSCPNAVRGDPYRYVNPQGTSLCRGQIITYFDASSGMDMGSCVLGDFTPIPEDTPLK
ncbi:hypothetical protein KCG44_11085 [Pacificimonas sp. WHA3]|uniref:Secreted protein n=1 Tax=Pacificimonas pallii TaxID=2827236 RepID=A0ABS6SH15_9SPHN|nr:hypothetical protein [Pacificimonas pallii]MBV7257328.1 hypothetical protein [Pacificimonas pallii]